MKIGELFIALGFDVDDKKLKTFKEDVKDGWQNILKLSAAAAAAVYSINRLLSGSVQSATALRDINAATGESIELMQRWANVLQGANPGETFAQATSELKGFIDAFTQAKIFGLNSTAFGRLGIGGLGDMNGMQALEAIRQAYQKNPLLFGNQAAQSQNLAQLGLGTDFINSANLKSGEFNKFWNFPIRTDQQVQSTVELGKAMQELEMHLNVVKNQWVAMWSPELIEHIHTAGESARLIETAISDIGDTIQKYKGTFEYYKEFLKYIAIGAIGILSPESLAIAGGSAILKQYGKDVQTGQRSWVTTQPLTKDWFEKTGITGGLINFKNWLNDINHRGLELELSRKRAAQGLPSGSDRANVTINQNNKTEIHSNADADEVARQIGTIMQRTLNQAYSQIGNGPL